MKNIFLIGGTMGVGKTATCQIMKNKLENCVFLDGDWCWDMHPFQVTEETKKMVIENICFLLNNFIKCSVYENIVFCWVMHEQNIIDDILFRLDAGIRTGDVIGKSVERISLYEKLSSFKVDVSEIDAEQAADFIVRGC